MIDETLVYDCHCGWSGIGSDLAVEHDYDWNGTSYIDCSTYYCPMCSSDCVTEQEPMLDDEALEYNSVWCSACNHTGKVAVFRGKEFVSRDVCRKCSGLRTVRVYTGYRVDEIGNRHKVDSKQ